MAKTAAERKADQRKRDDERNKEMGLEEICVFSQFKGTREHLDQIKQDHGFEQDNEVITFLIHNTANSDLSRQKEMLATPQHKTA